MPQVLFTASELQTVSGASFAVFLVVHLLKYCPLLKRIPTNLLAAIVGELLMLSVTSPLPSSLSEWVILFLNGLLVASAAVGGVHLVSATTSQKG